jgi:hypothetical protein
VEEVVGSTFIDLRIAAAFALASISILSIFSAFVAGSISAAGIVNSPKTLS